jgi:hypothetical protein
MTRMAYHAKPIKICRKLIFNWKLLSIHLVSNYMHITAIKRIVLGYVCVFFLHALGSRPFSLFLI